MRGQLVKKDPPIDSIDHLYRKDFLEGKTRNIVYSLEHRSLNLGEEMP